MPRISSAPSAWWGVPEVFAWDPNILDVDFISFHPYEYQPEQVRNELRWYGEHVDKPWIIGETSLPADNDSVPYTDQLEFARKTLAQARACGAVGYTWWQFQDVGWGRFHSDYMGVLDRTGETRVADGLPVVHGTVKPVAEAFREFRAGRCTERLPSTAELLQLFLVIRRKAHWPNFGRTREAY
jgi:hypothetical protein